jgi:hypothetical protein
VQECGPSLQTPLKRRSVSDTLLGATSLKTAIFILIAVTTSKLISFIDIRLQKSSLNGGQDKQNDRLADPSCALHLSLGKNAARVTPHREIVSACDYKGLPSYTVFVDRLTIKGSLKFSKMSSDYERSERKRLIYLKTPSQHCLR